MKKLSLVLSLVLFGIGTMLAQRTLSGTITDENGEPLVGATVLAKGTNTGTTTDIDGSYSLTVPEGVSTLVVSYTGFETQELELGVSDVLDVTLVEGVVLSDVVVTGTGVATDKRRTAIAVEAISSDELPQVTTGAVDQALIGKVPGAYIQQASGQPGQQMNIILRGINTLQNGTNPMIMIDGVQISATNTTNGSASNLSSRLADIDFANVERIEVVQGAAAATIYGAQGANGVIQIFTKKGRAGKPRINLSASVGFSDPINIGFEYADRHAYQTNAEGRILSGGGQLLGQDEFGIWSEPLLKAELDAKTDQDYVEPTFDLVDQVFRNNVANYRTSLSIAGGSDKINYSITGSFNDQEATIVGRNRRFNLGTRIGFELFPQFRVNVGATFINGRNTTGTITGQNNVQSALGSAVTIFPFVDFNFRNDQGFLIANPTGDNSVNPLFTNEFRRYTSNLVRILPNINLNWTPTTWLELDYKYGIDHWRENFQDYIRNHQAAIGDSPQAGIPPISGRISDFIRQETWQNSIASAFLRFGDASGIESTTHLAFDWRKRDFSETLAQGTGLPPYEPVNLAAASEANIDEFDLEFITYGFLVNQKLEWKRRIGISGGFRTDWSSAFGEGSDPFTFPRADIYIRPSEFAFWEGLKPVWAEWKVRAAWGRAGIQPGAFDRQVTLLSGQLGTGGFLAPNINQTNPLLDVEVSTEWEIGTDFSFTPGRGNSSWFPYIGFSFTYWNRNTEGAIERLELPPSAGAVDRLDNAFDLASDGIQMQLRLNVFDSKSFGWNFTTNFSRQQTTVDRIANGADFTVDDNFIIREGEQLGTFRGVRVLTSLDQLPEGENPDDYVVVPESGYVVNKNDNQVVFSDEVEVIGNALPDFNISFINDFRISNFLRFGFQLDWVQGFELYNQTRQWGYRDNLHGDVDDPVTIDGDNGAFLNYYRSLYNTNLPNSHFVEDGSFLRLRSAHIALDLARWIRGTGFNKLEVELSGFNLFTITDYTGFDPEAASFVNDPLRIGLDQYAFPNSRVFQVGVNIGFQ